MTAREQQAARERILAAWVARYGSESGFEMWWSTQTIARQGERSRRREQC